MLEVAANMLYTAGLLAKFRGKHVGPVLWCVVSTRTMRRSLILLLHAFSLAHARGGSQDEEKNLLLPPFTTRPYYLGYRDYIILFGIYMSFSRFQYELLVHTPNTDVYRRILGCRFTNFAPYVVHIETDVIVRTLPVSYTHLTLPTILRV